MNLLFFVGALTLLIIAASTHQQPPSACDSIYPFFYENSTGPGTSVPAISARVGMESFSNQLFPHVAEIQTSNFVASTFGQFISLYAVAFGAHGITADVMRNDFHLYTTKIDYKHGVSTLIKDLLNYREIDLHVASRLLYSRDLEICPKFIGVLKIMFHTNVEKVDFKEPKGVKSEWCAHETRNRFINPPVSDDVAGDKALEFMNVVYLKGSWAQKFDVHDTKKRPFYVSGDKNKLIPTMGVEGVFRHGEIEDPPATFVNLPFAFGPNGSHVASMFIVLPKGPLDLAAHEKLFSQKYKTQYHDFGSLEKLYVQLPKFRLSSKIDMIEPMKRVAKSRKDNLFEWSEANFKVITESDKLSIVEFQQFSTLDINEEGTEAVAAIGCGKPTEFADEAPAVAGPAPERNNSIKSFIVNRPFYARIIATNDDGYCSRFFSFRMSG